VLSNVLVCFVIVIVLLSTCVGVLYFTYVFGECGSVNLLVWNSLWYWCYAGGGITHCCWSYYVCQISCYSHCCYVYGGTGVMPALLLYCSTASCVLCADGLSVCVRMGCRFVCGWVVGLCADGLSVCVRMGCRFVRGWVVGLCADGLSVSPFPIVKLGAGGFTVLSGTFRILPAFS
jgi:hypothetical protein